MNVVGKCRARNIFFLWLALLMTVAMAVAQKPKPPVQATRSIIFAVFKSVFDDTLIEPIAVFQNGKLAPFSEGSSNDHKLFSNAYYKQRSKYSLIFGSAVSGSVTIKASNIGTECGGVSADVSVQFTKAKLNGFLMALATDFKPKAKNAFRRKPTSAERVEIEALVRAEFSKQKVSAAVLKNLHYYNLTALDIDNDGKAEFIGSYWVAPKTDKRDLLFFVAEMGVSGKYSLTHSEYSPVKPDDLMSGDIKHLDEMGGELLLDVLDYDNDGVSEIFTTRKAFEGNNYDVFKRVHGKWTKVFHTYDYRCGF